MKVKSVKFLTDVYLKTSKGPLRTSTWEVGLRGCKSIALDGFIVVVESDIASEDALAMPLSRVEEMHLLSEPAPAATASTHLPGTAQPHAQRGRS